MPKAPRPRLILVLPAMALLAASCLMMPAYADAAPFTFVTVGVNTVNGIGPLSVTWDESTPDSVRKGSAFADYGTLRFATSYVSAGIMTGGLGWQDDLTLTCPLCGDGGGWASATFVITGSVSASGGSSDKADTLAQLSTHWFTGWDSALGPSASEYAVAWLGVNGHSGGLAGSYTFNFPLYSFEPTSIRLSLGALQRTFGSSAGSTVDLGNSLHWTGVSLVDFWGREQQDFGLVGASGHDYRQSSLPVPEPASSLVLLGMGLLSIAAARQRRRSAPKT